MSANSRLHSKTTPPQQKRADVPEAKQMFVGPRPFQASDQKVFFGRGREARQLRTQVFCGRLTVVYAQSGAGKTSLINATLVPRLQDEGFEVLPIARVRRLLAPDEKLSPNTNVFVVNTLCSWDEAQPTEVEHFSLKQYLQQRKRGRRSEDDELPAPRAAIFDQFEELFTCHLDRWRDRQGFFEQLHDAVDDDERLRVVLVIREEFLARLDAYAHLIKEHFRGRFHLERLRKGAAMEAVREPFRHFGHDFSEEAAALLVKELSLERVMTEKGTRKIVGEFIEPVQLQVVCSSMSLNLPFHQKTITEKDFRVSEVTESLADFYTNNVRQAAARVNIKEGELRTKIECNFITRSGTRDTRMREPESTAGIANAAIDELENLHLVRAESSRGGTWYELSHDRFIEPIRQSNQKWFNDEILKRSSYDDSVRTRELEELAEWLDELDESKSPYGAELKSLAQSRRELASSQKDLASSNKALALARQQSVGHALAAHARILIDSGDEELAALLAWQAYVFNRRVAEQASARNEPLSSRLGRLVDSLLFDVLRNLHVSHALSGYAAPVAAVAFDPARRVLAIGSFDGTIRLWDLDRRGEGTIVLDQSGGDASDSNPAKWIQSVALARQGEKLILASGSEDRNVRWWRECNPDHEPWVFWGHSDVVSSVAFNQPYDPVWLAAGGRDRTVRLWDLRNPRAEHRVLGGHEHWVTSVAFSPEGDVLASGSLDGSVRLWHVDDTTKPFRVLFSGDHVRAVAFHPHGKLLAAGCEDGRVRGWHLNECDRQPTEFIGHERRVEAVAFSPDGQWMASGSDDQTVRLWDVNRPEANVAKLRGASGGVSCVSFSHDSAIVAASYWAGDGSVKTWLPSQAEFDLLAEGVVFTAAFSADGKFLACGTKNPVVPIWEFPEDGHPPHRRAGLTGHDDDDWARAVAFSPVGTCLATGSEKRTVRLWDFTTPDARPRLLGYHDDRVQAVAFSPDGELIASVSDDRTVRLWNKNGPHPSDHRLTGHTGGIRTVAFSPDHKWLASAGRDKTIRVWDLERLSDEPIVLSGHEGQVRSVAFSPDGQELASASDDKTFRLWKVQSFDAYHRTAEKPTVRKTSTSGLSSVAYCRKGAALAVGNWDHEIQLWDLAALEDPPIVLRPRIGPVSCLAVSGDSTWLAAGSNRENRVHVTKLDIDKLAESIPAKLWRKTLTPAEWSRFVGDDIPFEDTCD